MNCIICSGVVGHYCPHNKDYYLNKEGEKCERIYLACRSNSKNWCGYLQIGVKQEPKQSYVDSYCIPVIYNNKITLIKSFESPQNETAWINDRFITIIKIPYVPLELSNFNQEIDKIINKLKMLILFS